MSLEFRDKPALGLLRPLDCFAAVKLLTEHHEAGVVFPVGTHGVIVDTYDDGTYGVEFAHPAEDVVIVRREDLEPV